MIYLHSKYKYIALDYYTESDIWEGLFIEVSGNSLETNIIIGTIYKPPKNNNNNYNIQQFMNELDPVLAKLDSDNKYILLAGDSNINLLKINERTLRRLSRKNNTS